MCATGYDLHIHSSYSDGNCTVSEITQRANKLRLSAVAITDHFWPSLGSVRGGKSIIENRRFEIETARSDYPKLVILDGTEVDIQPNGSLAPVSGGLEQFDIVIGSFHWMSDSRTWSAALIKALRNPQFQVLAHWDGYLSSYREADGQAVVKHLVEAGVAVELSKRYLSEHTDFFESARDAGCKFTLGSDSHSIETIGQLDYQNKLASDLELELIEPRDLISSKF